MRAFDAYLIFRPFHLSPSKFNTDNPAYSGHRSLHKMAGGNKKKKKLAANPARGFATVSISKLKVEEPSAGESSAGTPDVPSDVQAGTEVAKVDDSVPQKERELHELNPEELEERLEASELQQFVEQHASKVRKETSRQVSRLQTEKRVLRGQADQLSLRSWLPDELMLEVVDLAIEDSQMGTSAMPKQSMLSGDELLSKVWTLRSCLLDLDIPPNRVEQAVGSVIAHPSSHTDLSLSWGLSAALEWLSIHCDPNELHEYDFEKPSSARLAVDDDEDSTTMDSDLAPEPSKNGSPSMYDLQGTSNGGPATDLEGGDIPVSDLDSDMEPDELLSTYLRTKTRLYEINPLSQEPASKRGRGQRAKTGPNGVSPPSRGESKLHQKLQKIESDALFDQREADLQWAETQIELARAAAERKRLQLSGRPENGHLTDREDADPTSEWQSNGVSKRAEKLGQELLEEAQSQDDVDLLGGMFSALPGVSDSGNGPSTSGSSGVAEVTIRDFGRITGIGPKRILEEACKSRDGHVKVGYKMVSTTTYASRHSVTIAWGKDQAIVEAPYMSGVDIKSRRRTTTLSALKVATPDTAQSEAYIATVALFVLFSSFPKEEKAHLKLPPTYRDLWDELVCIKREHADAEDRETVKQLRAFVEQHVKSDEDEEDEVVFNANSRNRANPASGVSTPIPRHDDTQRNGQVGFSQHLMDVWMTKTVQPSYQRMLLARINLPMYHFKGEALDAISRHQVTIIRGQTGSGKSTQVPAFILEHELSQGRHCKIYCTEPRRISAISLAQRVSEEMGDHKGDLGTARSLVGYAIRLESQSVASTRLIYATTGIVLRMLENADGLGDITHLVIDEVHERSIDTDFLLIILRSLLLRKPLLKVVLMSATVDAQRFSEYLDGAPVVDVPGRTFPVNALFLEDAIEVTGHTNEDASASAVDEEAADQTAGDVKGASQDLTKYSKQTRSTLANYDEYRIDYSLILKLLHKVAYDTKYQPFSKAVLVFLPGIAEIRQLNDMLPGHPAFAKGWRIHPLHSSFASEDQQAAFEIPPNGVRKIVLATNIAETGITIPDVTCVIDTGKHKEMRFDERRQMSRLAVSFIARANAKQRRGRAGRVQEGICFHLFTKHRHDELMAEQQTPEMLRLSLQDLVMRVKICKLGDIENALSQALDPPSSRNIRRAIDALVEVDALTPSEELTPLGLQLGKLPLDAQLGKLILLGSMMGCLDYALTAAATLSSKSPFLNPMHAKKQADTVRLGYKRGNSDLLTSYNAYCTWRKICTTPGLSEYQFCNKNFLSPQNLASIEDLKGQLLTALVDAGFVHLGPDERYALSRARPGARQRTFIALPASYCRADDDDNVINSVTAWSFYPKIIKQEGNGWRNIANNQSLRLHPTSVNKTGLPSDIKLLSFYSIMQSTSRFTNAQETSPAPEISLVLLAGDAVFYMYAGVIVIDGNRLRLKVKDWKTMIVLKTLRSRFKEVLARLYKYPGRELQGKYKLWMEIIEKMFETQRKKA